MLSRAPTVRYAPVNHCIYCGKADVQLTDEHIIPLALHGEHLLPQASCDACRETIQKVEDTCLRIMLRPYRALVGFATRRPKHRLNPFPLDVIKSGGERERIEVPLDEHPATLVLCALGCPRILSESAAEEGFWGPVIYADVNRLKKLFLQHGYSRLGIGRLYWVEYARVLAKIAHGFAHAMMRGEPYYPILEFLLPDVILGNANDPFEFVGGTTEQLPASTSISEIENYYLTIGDVVYVMFKIRLFSYLQNSPVHIVATARFARQELATRLGRQIT